jgi:hypothetical protein
MRHASTMRAYINRILRHRVCIPPSASIWKQQILQCATMNMKFSSLFQQNWYIALLTCLNKVIINKLNHMFNQIRLKEFKSWVDSTNISDVAYIAITPSIGIIGIIGIIGSVIWIIIIGNSYRYITFIVPECIARNADIQCNHMDIVFA